MSKARVVYEHFPAHTAEFGTCQFSKVGFAIGDRVFWTGVSGPYAEVGVWQRDKLLAEEVVKRWNAALTESHV